MAGFARVVALALALGVCAVAARADPVADFYRGRTITVYVGSGPGGGYDAYGRLLARHLGRFMPGHPQLVAVNMPGASSRAAANHLFNKAPKDGTAIAAFQAPIVMDPLLYGPHAPGVLYDPLRFAWIGSLDQFTPIVVVWHVTGITTLAGARGREIKFGSSGGDVSERIYAQLLNTTLGTDFVPVAGYSGSAEITLAIERGEIPAFVGWYWAGMKRMKPQWVEQHLANVLLQMGARRDPDLGGVPWVMDEVTNESDREVWRFVLSNLSFARPFAAPPGTPPERVAALRNAFQAMAADGEFRADAEKAMLDINVFSGAEIDALLQRMFASPPSVRARVRAAIEGHLEGLP
jgi:tripartite-type tricarboxylate transporter receptor subunit TctC